MAPVLKIFWIFYFCTEHINQRNHFENCPVNETFVLKYSYKSKTFKKEREKEACKLSGYKKKN